MPGGLMELRFDDQEARLADIMELQGELRDALAACMATKGPRAEAERAGSSPRSRDIGMPPWVWTSLFGGGAPRGRFGRTPGTED